MVHHDLSAIASGSGVGGPGWWHGQFLPGPVVKGLAFMVFRNERPRFAAASRTAIDA